MDDDFNDYEDDDLDEEDDFENDDDLFADGEGGREKSPISDDDVALDAFADGQMDAEYSSILYAGYGLSVDDDKLTDAQKDLYDTEYLAGYQDQQIRDELDGDSDDF